MQVLRIGAGLLTGAALMVSAWAGPVVGPMLVSGSLPDSPAERVDPNVSSSPWSGVVSINIRYDGLSYICSGAMIDSTHVLTAGHCVDTTGNGDMIDITKQGNDVRVVYNSNGTFNGLVTASSVVMHPDYEGFGNCPIGVPGFCVNDDIAIIELPTPAPEGTKTYSLWGDAIGGGQEVAMVGYGTSGNGWDGFNVSPSFFVKRVGGNVFDIFETDDEQFTGFDANGFISGAGPNEVWYADFDGVLPNGFNLDPFCILYGVCGGSLGNGIETNLGGGDSGGPSFLYYHNKYYLVANNTCGGQQFEGLPDGGFGSLSCGILLNSYADWISANSDIQFKVPEPAALALTLSGFVGLAFLRRRRKA